MTAHGDNPNYDPQNNTRSILLHCSCFLYRFTFGLADPTISDFEKHCGNPLQNGPPTPWPELNGFSLGFLFTPINGLIWARRPYFLLLFRGPETVVPASAPEEEHLPNRDS